MKKVDKSNEAYKKGLVDGINRAIDICSDELINLNKMFSNTTLSECAHRQALIERGVEICKFYKRLAIIRDAQIKRNKN